jgi:hypothetical protein
MNSELVKEICVKPDGVYLRCKQSNSDGPYRLRKSERLTTAYTRNGQRGLDVEAVQMFFWRFCIIRGDHPSVARFRPCMEKARGIYDEAVTKIENKYTELALTDGMLREPNEKLSDEAKAYQAFSRETRKDMFERMADLADPPEKRPPVRDDRAR